MTKGKNTLKCRRCGEEATRQLSIGRHSFNFDSDGPRPQNTGVSSIDHDVDMIIGRDSSLRLREMQRRQEHKKEIMRREGVSGEYLRKTIDGTYEVISEQERRAGKAARIINQEALRLLYQN